MSKIKQNDYGFKTPVRRGVNNKTGNKVGGDLSGGDCKICYFYQIKINKKAKFEFLLDKIESKLIFERDVCVVGAGGYFLSESEVSVTLELLTEGNSIKKEFLLQENRFEKIGIDELLEKEQLESLMNIKLIVEFNTPNESVIQYTKFSFGFVDFQKFVENDYHDSYFNSKRNICIPEQFYFNSELQFDGSIDGTPLILKSCNRCQRFLPINHLNERNQVAFSNHCSTKAPCIHGNFSNYKIAHSELSESELETFLQGTPYKLENSFLISYHGHQLECKACKKFFVNTALNHLRTSTQHREDSLRRRAFELMVRKLLNIEWIYHSFRSSSGIEFDKYIWEKFDKKCFNCGKSIMSPKEMDLDHTMPLAYLYPLDETATCLCSTCNSSKSDLFPIDFYNEEQLVKLSTLTGLSLKILSSRLPNETVIKELKNNLKWFFEEFITFEDYNKERDGKKASDSIVHSLQKVINKSSYSFSLIDEYERTK